MDIVDFITIFTLTAYIFTLFYLRSRQEYRKKVKKEKDIEITKKDILVPTGILIGSLLCIFLIFTYLFYLVALKTLIIDFTDTSLLVVLIYFLSYYLFAFSNGIYLYTIIMETLVVKRIKLSKRFLRIYKYLYGPVSNVLVYFFGGLIFLLNSALEYLTESYFYLSNTDFLRVIIFSVLFGILYYYAALMNDTWRDQIKTAIFLLVAHLCFAIFFDIDYRLLPFSLFFLISTFIYLTLLIYRYIEFRDKKQIYNYDWIEIK